MTLFRRDNAKSVCLFHGVPLAEGFHFSDDDDDHILTYSGFADPSLARNETPTIARVLIDEFTNICADFSSVFVVNVPTFGSDDQPQWLTNSRQAIDDRWVYEPSATDMAALSKIDYFDFGLKEICIQFHVRPSVEGEIEQLTDPNQVLLVLEGLCWE